MSTEKAVLDKEELLHLAVNASNRHDTGRAIEYLKQALEVDPRYAKALHLLGAEHAQIGMFERAMEDMEAALTIDPEMHVARFQLGLLYLSSRMPSQAQATLEPLDVLDEGHALLHFKRGLLHLAKDEFSACVDSLRHGMTLNQFSEPLNRDMQRIIDDVLPLLGGGDDGQGGGEGHLFLNAYARDSSTH